MSDLPPEKELTHTLFCQQVAAIKDVNVARVMLTELHLAYLKDQASMIAIAKQEFMGGR